MVFKVTTRDNLSLLAPPALVTPYVPGEWTYPKIPGTKLLCFSSLEFAEQFAERFSWHDGWVIWEAEAQATEACPLVACLDVDFAERDPVKLLTQKVINFWRSLDGPEQSDSLARILAPEGTVSANAVKLVKPSMGFEPTYPAILYGVKVRGSNVPKFR